MTDQMNPAERLRAAATRLRELAVAATAWGNPWEVDAEHPARVIEPKGWNSALVAKCVDYSDAEVGTEQAAYIALMSPPVALALADWLDVAADNTVPGDDPMPVETRVADAVLGGEQS